MICEPCRIEADSAKRSDNPELAHSRFRFHKEGHDKCTGCDCRHKNVGSCIPVE